MAIRSSITEVMSGLHIVFFATLFFTLVLHGCGRKNVLSKDQDLELPRQLNKHAIKTIKTEYGDIIDCVDIYKQPAFDHPLLKNHTLQRRPSSIPPVVKKEALSLANALKVHQSNRCPSGSIPIRRTTNAGTVGSQRSNIVNNKVSPGYSPGSHFSSVKILHDEDEILYGARTYIDAYNPIVEAGQSSAAQIWIQAGPTSHVNSIEVGWVVDLDLYGDKRTHLFAYWTADGYRTTGCYNILCPGFVQIDEALTIGAALSNTSTINGEQYGILVFVYQDQTTGNWWLMVSDDKKFVGYWPKELFPYLSKGAENVAYGGRAQGGVNHSPPMGSGLKPDSSDLSFNHICFFANAQYVNPSKKLQDPNYWATKAINDKSDCFGLDNHAINADMGYTILFGGPGGQCGG